MKLKISHLVLLLPSVFFIGVALEWSQSPRMGISGDEPHYLIIAKSIIDDFDLDVKNNYDYDAIHSEIMGPVDRHVTSNNGKEYSVHLFGLPIIISLPFYLFGIMGVKFFMCLLSTLIPLLAYKIFLPKLNSEVLSSWAAATFSISLPFLIAASQIYCEIVTGLILCWSIIILFKMIDHQPPRFATRLIWILCLSFLIFVHIKNVLPVFLICLIYLIINIVRIKTNKNTLKASLYQCSLLIIPLLLVILLTIYINIIKGEVTSSPYYTSPIKFDFQENVRVFLMYHFDQASGLFFQNPFTLVGLLGLIPLFMDNKIKGTVYLSIYIPIMLLNSLVLGFFDGPGFIASRFMWAPAILWLIPMSYGLKYLKENFRPEFISTVFILCLTFQLDNLIHWITIDPGQINWQGGFIPLYDMISAYLPSFKPDLLNSSINALYLAGAVLVVMQPTASNWNFSTNGSTTKIFPKVWIVYFFVFFILIVFVIQPKKFQMHDVTLNYKNVSAAMGQPILIDNEEIWQSDANTAGIVWYGPYMFLKNGVYDVTYFMETGVLSNNYVGPLVYIDICTDFGQTVLNQRLITTDDKSNQFKVALKLKYPTSFLEFRIIKYQNSFVRIKKILVQQVGSN